MRFKKLVAVASLAIVVTASSAASAEPAVLTALRQGVRGLEGRAKVVRNRSEASANTALRKDIDRILRIIEFKRLSLVIRVAAIDLLGADVDSKTIQEVASYFESTNNLLSTVERWFYIR